MTTKMSLIRTFYIPVLATFALATVGTRAADSSGAEDFRKNIRPILEKYCFDCHADGTHKGSVAFDEFKTDEEALGDRKLWLQALKNLRAGLMPPEKKARPMREEQERIEQWIKREVFEIDPKNPDPGRATIRRLNRVEYRNTIRDLLDVDFDVAGAFPPDDTGHGFDNIGEVLTLPPMLLEKYVTAANQIIAEAVPTVSGVMRERQLSGWQFVNEGGRNHQGKVQLSYYKAATVTNLFTADIAGKYQIAVALLINEKFVEGAFDHNKCRLVFRVDGKEMFREEFGWEGGKPHHYNCELDWEAGKHELEFELKPLTPNEPQARSLSIQLSSVKLSGPTAQKDWVTPKNHERFFPGKIPDDAEGRRIYARELLAGFTRRAFRRPADEKTLGRLVELAESIYSQPGKTFEAGISKAMIAVLASPRFLFRVEHAEVAAGVSPAVEGGILPPGSARELEKASSSSNPTEKSKPIPPGETPGSTAGKMPAAANVHPLADEFSLASRLSYFLWSSMPDEELLKLAGAGELRNNLNSQVERMLKDERSESFVKNFVGQWLRARDIENIPIESGYVISREEKPDAERDRKRRRFRELSEKPFEQRTAAEREEMNEIRESFERTFHRPLLVEMTPEIRTAMRLETEKTFEHVLRKDRSLLELLDSDYTFLNERLAVHYGVPNVTGNEMRLVKLPADSPRGGILAQGTVLGVTSNPTRTSPVKRGVFVLENILGTPPSPPPPNVPPLEDAAKGATNRTLTLRETLAVHRENALCSSCHNRMDPLGLALDNFNAMGMWRDAEFGVAIDSAGKLITGENFNNVREMKRLLVKNHSADFYHTVTEKLLIYALGRGLEYYDVETCDQIVARIQAADGRTSALIAGVVESTPFQRIRRADKQEQKKAARTDQQRADAARAQ